VIVSIIVPLLRPVFNIVIALNMVQGFRVFTLVYAMTSGGPAHATEVLSTYIVQTAFQEHNMGYAAALSVMLFLVVFAVAMAFLQPFREHEVQY
jgi:raffinose/stachyose/melibiose transport system permease protein